MQASELDVARAAVRSLSTDPTTTKNDVKRATERVSFLEANGGRLAELRQFNIGVNTRQVRRNYARIIAKKGEQV